VKYLPAVIAALMWLAFFTLGKSLFYPLNTDGAIVGWFITINITLATTVWAIDRTGRSKKG
jgi:hypothetical protein